MLSLIHRAHYDNPNLFLATSTQLYISNSHTQVGVICFDGLGRKEGLWSPGTPKFLSWSPEPGAVGSRIKTDSGQTEP